MQWIYEWLPCKLRRNFGMVIPLTVPLMVRMAMEDFGVEIQSFRTVMRGWNIWHGQCRQRRISPFCGGWLITPVLKMWYVDDNFNSLLLMLIIRSVKEPLSLHGSAGSLHTTYLLWQILTRNTGIPKGPLGHYPLRRLQYVIHLLSSELI